MAGALPNGNSIETFSTEKLSENSLRIKMTPANCGHGIPLISVEGVPRTDGDQQSSFHFLKINATISVTRTKAASPPLTGTFDLTHTNRTIRGMYGVAAIKKHGSKSNLIFFANA